MSGPTQFADLNALLGELVAGLRGALGDALVGVYLQGSFAVGDADEHSDVDFLAVTRGPVRQRAETALRALHTRLHAPAGWAAHLEGSYAPADELRSIACAGLPWLYLDNGASELTRDAHCNTAVVRWSLREHGVTLYGPPPATLVDPVPPEALRDEVVLGVVEVWQSWPYESQTRFERGDGRPGMSRWKQPYVVLSYCRMLHTMTTGAVHSKKASGEWALDALDPRWRSLIQAALHDRPDPWRRVHQAAPVEAIDATLAFADYAVAEIMRGSAATAPSSGPTDPR